MLEDATRNPTKRKKQPIETQKMSFFFNFHLFSSKSSADASENNNNGNAGVPVPTQEQEGGSAAVPVYRINHDVDEDAHYYGSGDEGDVAASRLEAIRREREEMYLMQRMVARREEREEMLMTPEQLNNKEERRRLEAEHQKENSRRLHREFKLRKLAEGKVYTDRPAHFESYPYTTPAPLRRLFDALDYTKTVIGGSYSLHTLMTWRRRTATGYFLRLLKGGLGWQPDDIDIMIKCDTKAEFDREAERIENRVGCMRIVKDLWIGDHGNSNYSRRQLVEQNGGNFQNEDFHNYIRGVKNYRLDGLDKKVQLVCMSHLRDNGERMRVCGCDDFVAIEDDKDVTITHILDRITDYPACVTAKIVRSGEMEFRVPDDLNEVLRTMEIPSAWICQYRKVKYGQRGFRIRERKPEERKFA